ncbi:unnamed protein product [Sphenostylis stenocarpa]|uniref:Uncharacterized protein n=1 Tax=Sphenostylis stenocarpa TaxID=92480 RepID=A0AA86VCH0_9FABA|nr:unnamed protein product [Sphenostylis stenocarpa]
MGKHKQISLHAILWSHTSSHAHAAKSMTRYSHSAVSTKSSSFFSSNYSTMLYGLASLLGMLAFLGMQLPVIMAALLQYLPPLCLIAILGTLASALISGIWLLHITGKEWCRGGNESERVFNNANVINWNLCLMFLAHLYIGRSYDCFPRCIAFLTHWETKRDEKGLTGVNESGHLHALSMCR